MKKPKPTRKLKGRPLTASAAVQTRYYASLRKMIDRMADITRREIERLYKRPSAREHFAEDESVASQARILLSALEERFSAIFDMPAKDIAASLADDVDRNSISTLRLSLKELSGGITLKTSVLTGELSEITKAVVAENVGLIRTIPAQYLNDVRGAVMRSITTGNGLADLVPYLRDKHNVTLKRARFIATDQTRKAYAGLNKARLEKLGVKKYEWLHSGGGQHPRKLHQSYSGKTFSWDDPPIIDEKTGERGHPGQLINCRCRAIPIIEFEE